MIDWPIHKLFLEGPIDYWFRLFMESLL